MTHTIRTIAVMAVLLAAGIQAAEAVPDDAIAADVAPVLTPVVRWNQTLPAVNSHETLPVMAGPGGGRLYTVSGGQLLTLETESGKLINATAGNFRGGPVCHGATLLVTGDDWLKALDITGDAPVVSWTARTVGRIQSDSKYCEVLGRSRATVVGDWAIFGGPGKCGLGPSERFTDTRLYAVEAKTGVQAWVLDTTNRMVCGRMIAADAGLGLCFVALTGERTERMIPIMNGPDAGKPRLHAEGGTNGVVIAVEISTGKEKWRTAIGSHMAASGPALVEGVLYCAGNTEAMALRASDGMVLWRTARTQKARASQKNGVINITPTPPVAVTKDVFVTALEKTVDAFDRKDGSLRWSVKRKHDVGAMTLAAARHVVYTAASHSGIVQAIDAASGKLLWEHMLPGNEATECVSLLPMEGRLVVGSRSPAPRIYCLENAAGAKAPDPGPEQTKREKDGH
jgi:outer membrane protein assembly factor BamB